MASVSYTNLVPLGGNALTAQILRMLQVYFKNRPLR